MCRPAMRKPRESMKDHLLGVVATDSTTELTNGDDASPVASSGCYPPTFSGLATTASLSRHTASRARVAQPHAAAGTRFSSRTAKCTKQGFAASIVERCLVARLYTILSKGLV
jgi:hypothetical protein